MIISFSFVLVIIVSFLKVLFPNEKKRADKGALLENLVFRNLIINTDFDEIKFWRTQNKNEVDFVIEGEKKAYEIKTNLKNIELKKYSLFLKTYDTFNLEFIDLEKSLSFFKKTTH